MATGIEFGYLPGCIPVFHEVSACNAANYRYFGDWQELTPDQQAFLIGHHLTKVWLENNEKDAEVRKMKQDAKKGGKT